MYYYTRRNEAKGGWEGKLGFALIIDDFPKLKRYK